MVAVAEQLESTCQQLVEKYSSMMESVEAGKHPEYADFEEMLGAEAADIVFEVSANKNDWVSARVVLGLGQPNVWVDTFASEIVATFGGERVVRSYICEGFDDAVAARWESLTVSLA